MDCFLLSSTEKKGLHLLECEILLTVHWQMHKLTHTSTYTYRDTHTFNLIYFVLFMAGQNPSAVG